MYGVPLHYPSKRTRKKEVLWLRQALHYLARKLTPLSYREIGEVIGRRNHATVIHSVNLVANEYDRYDDRKDFIDAIERELTFMGFSTEKAIHYGEYE